MALTRGKTFRPTGNPAKRPPKLKGRVANDVYANPARSMMSPPPTKDTQEPRGMVRSRGGGKKGLTKGGQGGRIS
jgi:hypothetical protein